MTDLISIGQFAALTSLSPKALRLYHDNGLLEPAIVDPSSGYRYYDPCQLPTATAIAVMRRAGLALSQIAEHLATPSVERVDRWRAELEAEMIDRRLALDHLAHITQSLQEPAAPPKELSMPTTTTADTSLVRAIPVLASVDIDATARFYTERFGFEVIATYPDYLVTARDDIEIHFWLTDDAEIPKQTSCYVRVQGVDALYAEMQAAGVVHPNGPLTDQFYGIRDFAVLDGDGNLVKFGERVETDE